MIKAKSNSALILGALVVAAVAMFATPDVFAAPTGTTKDILMDRTAIESAGGGVDLLVSNTVGGLGTTTLKALYSAAYVIGALFVLVGIVGWRNQYKQDETQRKFALPLTSIIFGVGVAGFTTVFGLMSDTMGFGAAIDDGVDSSINLSKPKTGIGVGSSKERW